MAPKILMSCSPEKTLLVGDVRSLEWTLLWEREMCGFSRGPSSSGSRVQPRGKGKQGSRLEIPRECLHSTLEACARGKQWPQMRSMKSKVGVFSEGKTEQDRTGQGLGQEERDIGDVIPRLDRLAGFRPLWLLMI